MGKYIYIYIYIYVIKFPSGCPLACANSAFPGDSPTAAEAANSSSCTGPSNNSTAFRRKGRVHVCLWVCAHIESFVSFCKGPDLRRSRLSFLSSLLFFCIHTCTCTRACTCKRIRTRTQTRKHTHAHAQLHTRSSTRSYKLSRTRAHTKTHPPIHPLTRDRMTSSPKRRRCVSRCANNAGCVGRGIGTCSESRVRIMVSQTIWFCLYVGRSFGNTLYIYGETSHTWEDLNYMGRHRV
jgi:hypothetical protein